MDTLTHIAFGASIGGVLMGRKAGAPACIWGAALANLPDIDALFHNDAIGYLLIHRGITHSLFFQLLAVPALVLLILAIHRDQRRHWLGWTALTALALASHSLMDAMNPYGAQLLAPFSNQAISFNMIYVVDPLFTLPLVIGLCLAWRWRATLMRPILAGSLAVALSYITIAAGIKLHIQAVAESELARQGLPVESAMVMPMPFTTLLWRVLTVDDQGFHEGYISLVDGQEAINFSHGQSEPKLLEQLSEHVPVQQLRRFAKGFYQVEAEGAQVVIRDLRLGQNSYYPVSFVVGYLQNDTVTPASDQRMPATVPREQIGWLWRRIWQPSPGNI